MKLFTTLLIFLLLNTFSSFAQDSTTSKTEKENKKLVESAIAANHAFFETEDVLEITFTADLKALRKDIKENRAYHPSTISYKNEEGENVDITLKAKTRGNSRRSKNMCDFPPLRLNFQSNNTKGSIFEGQDKLKLVVHCQDADETYKEYVIREYLVYKAYQLLTDKSFRVRLLKINYVDSGNKDKKTEKYGFIIEAEEFVAQRLKGKMLKNKKIHSENTDRPTADRVAVFQYMIGNLDWSVKENHNMKMCYKAGGIPFCIPYDFDLTGIVDTEYALPPEILEVKSVRERLYRGYCRTPEEFEVIFEEFRNIKEDLYALYNSSDFLNEKYVKSTLKYLDDFYEIINNPKLVKQQFLKKCRKTQ